MLPRHMGLPPLPGEACNLSTVHATGLGSGSLDPRPEEPSRQDTEPNDHRRFPIIDLGPPGTTRAIPYSSFDRPGDAESRNVDT